MVVGTIESTGNAVTPDTLAGTAVDSVAGFGESPEAQALRPKERATAQSPEKNIAGAMCDKFYFL
jgi:hypothetical protein